MTVQVNQSGLDTLALFAEKAFFMGGLLLKNIDKIKSVTNTLVEEVHDYEDSLIAEKVAGTSSDKAVNRLMNELVVEKFGNNIARRRTDVEEFFKRWRFIFSLPSMRNLLPLLTRDPLKKLKVLFPSPLDIRKFISNDLCVLHSPLGIRQHHKSQEYIKGPNRYKQQSQDFKFLPYLNLLE